MGVKGWLTAALATVALSAGATWGYMHYEAIFGDGDASCPSQCITTYSCCTEATSCCSASEEASCCEGEAAEQPAAAKNCCETPSRQSAVAKE
jgi:hypothetical protein